MQDHLNGLRLQLNWRRSTVYPTRTGIPFLGFRIFADPSPPARRQRAPGPTRLHANRDAVRQET